MVKKAKRARTSKGKRSIADLYDKSIPLTDPRSDGRVGREHAGRIRVVVHLWDKAAIRLDTWVGRADFGVCMTKREAKDVVRALREGMKKMKSE